MILPDLVLSTRANQHWQFSGMDSLENCIDKKHFKSYPYAVDYDYNSRGFRDSEWPEDIDQLTHAIWCVGDSFTEGLGSPAEHAWPFLLQNQTNMKTINVSMDGASNDWISRRSCDIINTIRPKKLIIHWSYTHRREDTIENGQQIIWSEFYNSVKDITWPDCDNLKDFDQLPERIQVEIINQHNWIHYKNCIDEHRKIYAIEDTTPMDDNINLLYNMQLVESTAKNNTQVIHSFIPEFSFNIYNRKKNSDIVDFTKIINNELQSIKCRIIPEFHQLDLARDGHHYDIITANYFVDQIVNLTC